MYAAENACDLARARVAPTSRLTTRSSSHDPRVCGIASTLALAARLSTFDLADPRHRQEHFDEDAAEQDELESTEA